MDKTLKKFLIYAGAIKLYEIWTFYLYLKDTWGQNPLPEHSATYYSLNHYSLFWLVAEIAFFYIMVRFKARNPAGLGMKLAQAGAIAAYLPFIFTNKESIPYFSLFYAIALTSVAALEIYLLFSNWKYSWKYIERFKPQARVLRSR